MADCDLPCIQCPPPPAGGEGLGLSPNDPNNPFVNLSSEAPDRELFIGIQNQPPGIGFPPLGSTWYAAGCLGFCFSTESQEAADLCAQQQAVFCLSPNWPVPNPNRPNPNFPNPNNPNEPPTVPVARNVYSNTQQSCPYNCPDGGVFYFIVPAGIFSGFTQAEADAFAASYACKQAPIRRTCLGDFSTTRACSESVFSSILTASSANLPVTFIVVDGGIPIGLVESQSPSQYMLSGTPEVPGDYAFTLRATDPAGNYTERSYSISIFGFTNSAELPEADEGEPYSEQLNYAGTATGDVIFSLVSGAFPSGIALNPLTGEIAGTPTESGDFTVVLRISDDAISCQKEFTVTVAQSLSPVVWWTMDLGIPTAEIDSVAGLVLSQGAGSALDFQTVVGVVNNGFGLIDVTPAASALLWNNPVSPIINFNGSGISFAFWLKWNESFVGTDSVAYLAYQFVIGPDTYQLQLVRHNFTASNDWQLILSRGATTLAATVTYNPAIDTWHFFVIDYDADAETISIEINRTDFDEQPVGAPSPGASASGRILVAASAGPLGISRQSISVDELAVFDGVLSEESRDYLYNSGAGRTYPF